MSELRDVVNYVLEHTEVHALVTVRQIADLEDELVTAIKAFEDTKPTTIGAARRVYALGDALVELPLIARAIRRGDRISEADARRIEAAAKLLETYKEKN